MRFDCRNERPSWEDMVPCRETGINDEDDDVEARERRDGCCSIVATDILRGNLCGSGTLTMVTKVWQW